MTCGGLDMTRPDAPDAATCPGETGRSSVIRSARETKVPPSPTLLTRSRVKPRLPMAVSSTRSAVADVLHSVVSLKRQTAQVKSLSQVYARLSLCQDEDECATPPALTPAKSPKPR